MTNEQLNNIFDEFKTRLMKEIKPEIVNGVWYKYTDGNSKFNYTDIDKKEGYGYGWWGHFTHSKWIGENLTPMTHDEIKDMLIKHAVSLGIKEGVMVDGSLFKADLVYRVVTKLGRGYYNYIQSKDSLTFDSKIIYKKGVWATLVKEKTSEEWVKEYTSPVCLKEFMQINNLEFIQRK